MGCKGECHWLIGHPFGVHSLPSFNFRGLPGRVPFRVIAIPMNSFLWSPSWVRGSQGFVPICLIAIPMYSFLRSPSWVRGSQGLVPFRLIAIPMNSFLRSPSWVRVSQGLVPFRVIAIQMNTYSLSSFSFRGLPGRVPVVQLPYGWFPHRWHTKSGHIRGRQKHPPPQGPHALR